jgi:hypothetical protein
MKLLNTNYKLEKEVPGYRILGLSLAPHTMAGGPTVCPYSTVECRSVCLGTETGMNRFKAALDAKVQRTRLWQKHPDRFRSQLATEVFNARRAAKKAGHKLAVRLNVYSDIEWEREFCELFTDFADVQFYDYTKVPKRFARPRNYHLTYSYTGTTASARTAVEYLERRVNTAVVFPSLPPEVFRFTAGGPELTVVNGDLHDFRPIDPWPAVVGLKFKGGAQNLVGIKKFVQEVAA